MDRYGISEDELKEYDGQIPVPVIPQIELDLHGMTVDEAIPLVDRYLEDSYNQYMRQVWIVHGKGTGVLREAVRGHLKDHRLVKSSAPADSNHVEEGATEVIMID